MRKIIRYFHENKQKILIIVGMLAFIIFIVHFLNSVIRKNNISNNRVESNTSKIQDVTIPNRPAVSDEKIPNEKVKEDAEFIRDFVSYCNEKKYEEAYNLLSEDCKEVLYPDLKKFTDDYVDYIFKTKKIYNLELWQNDTYKITYYEDNLLATGGQTTNNNYVDYITITEQEKEVKINISSFVGKRQMNRKKVNNNITVKINSKLIYIDYEIYNISVINNNSTTICLSNNRNEKDVILIDKEDNEHNSSVFEVDSSKLIIEPNDESNFDIKFGIAYKYDNGGETIQFKNVCMDYEEYQKTTDKDNFKKVEIEINM